MKEATRTDQDHRDNAGHQWNGINVAEYKSKVTNTINY